MKTKSDNSQYLICESKFVYVLLIFSAGMMGAYTFNLRGGVFCNAQTANFVMMAIAFGQGKIKSALYFFVPISAYLLGAIVSEAFPSPIKHKGFLRWDTYLVGFEAIVLFILGFIPLSAPDQIVQVAVNFIASMQYNTFRQAEGVPMATTFCTNHLRQVGVAITKTVRKRDGIAFKRGLLHTVMLVFFVLGGVILTFGCRYLKERAIWLALVPMLLLFGRLVYADLCKEHDLLERKPAGH